MHRPDAAFRWTELDRTTYPAWAEGIVADDRARPALSAEPRSYPGHPEWVLPRPRGRLWPALDRVLAARRTGGGLGTVTPSRRVLGRLLGLAHGITGPAWRGPTPSAGGLQALELYLATFSASWLPAGVYHYNRGRHLLAQLEAGGDRAGWQPVAPSLDLLEGGAVLWVLVGDGARVRVRYAERGLRFLLLEAGHLMQSLCLVSVSLGLRTVPLGGYFERAIAGRLRLLDGDEVLYLGLCGR